MPRTEPRPCACRAGSPALSPALCSGQLYEQFPVDACLKDEYLPKNRSRTPHATQTVCLPLCRLTHLCQKTQRVPLHAGFMRPLLVASGLATCASLPSSRPFPSIGSFPSSVDTFVVLVFLTLQCSYQLRTFPGSCQPRPHSPVIGWCGAIFPPMQ